MPRQTKKSSKSLSIAQLDNLTDAQTRAIARHAYAALPPAKQQFADHLISVVDDAQKSHERAEQLYRERFAMMERAYRRLSVALGLQPNFLF